MEANKFWFRGADLSPRNDLTIVKKIDIDQGNQVVVSDSRQREISDLKLEIFPRA